MTDEGPRVGVLLVGGFLGAGKTTLLRRLVRDPQLGPRLAVLVNELGTLGVDGELIRGAAESAALRTVQLDSGCLCCTLKGSLGDALLELARPAAGPPPTQIVVELSGAALASEVHFQIGTQALDAPYFADGLVCVVDAVAAPRWAAESAALFADQLARADLVLLSKLDVASAETRAATEALIARIAPSARVVPCAFGEIDPGLLLGLGGADIPAPAGAHAHGLHGETIEIPVLTEDRLRELLEALAPAYYRVKGIVEVRATDGGVHPLVVQCVGDQIELAPAAARPAVPRLVFIAPRVDRQEICALVARAASS